VNLFQPAFHPHKTGRAGWSLFWLFGYLVIWFLIYFVLLCGPSGPPSASQLEPEGPAFFIATGCWSRGSQKGGLARSAGRDLAAGFRRGPKAGDGWPIPGESASTSRRTPVPRCTSMIFPSSQAPRRGPHSHKTYNGPRVESSSSTPRVAGPNLRFFGPRRLPEVQCEVSMGPRRTDSTLRFISRQMGPSALKSLLLRCP
jgi:hypothetical protein